MTSTGQKKTTEKPPKTPSEGTEYQIRIAIIDTDLDNTDIVLWRDVGTITTKGGAPSARRQWAAAAGPDYIGQELEAVPTSNVNRGAFDVAIERKLTPKATPAT